MAHHNTVFVQVLRFLPRHEFEAEARQHQRGQGLRVMSRWAQFVALGSGVNFDGPTELACCAARIRD